MFPTQITWKNDLFKISRDTAIWFLHGFLKKICFWNLLTLMLNLFWMEHFLNKLKNSPHTCPEQSKLSHLIPKPRLNSEKLQTSANLELNQNLRNTAALIKLKHCRMNLVTQWKIFNLNPKWLLRRLAN